MMKQKLSVILLAFVLLMTSAPSNVHAEDCVEHQGEWQVVDEPTCYYEGTECMVCENCHERQYRIVPAAGHQWGEWEIEKEPTCSTSGYKVKKCTVCNTVESEIIPGTKNHNWEEWNVFDEPTCQENGLEERECADCSATEEREIPKTPKNHLWTEWKIAKQATALSEGKKTRYCKYCDETETKSIPKLKAKISLMEKSVKVESGKSHVLKIKSKTRGDKIQKWTSSNKAIATVDQSGKVTAKREGTATITIKMESGVTSTCKIHVIRPTPASNPQSGNSGSQSGGNAENTVVPSDTNSCLTVYITDTGEKYHRAGCRYLRRSQRAITKSDAQSRGYTPCSVCRP